MAAILNVQTSTQIFASENWDDDFEFQQESNKSEQHPHRRHVGVAEARKASITSSALEDWDADEDPTNVHPSTFATSSQTVLRQHVERQTDNWDDDFEDARNSPKKVVNTTNPSQRREESWDEDGDLGDETDDDSAEFGFAEKEEDRTVTAKSRRAALRRLSSSPSAAPPPMPPPLPTNFLFNLSQQPAQSGPYRTFQQQPFPPRSPTSSVFSVPTTAHTIHDQYYSSTTHLRPTSAFALLPPSPPIHKERERRRLRKKSRPKPQGTFELVSLRGSSVNASETRLASSHSAGPSDSNRHRYSFSDEGDAEPSTSEAPPPPQQTHTDTSSADDRRAITPAIATPSLPQTPAKGSALLSRIGSVKKWGVRRKRASTTPSEVIANDLDPHRTPRAKSSRASFHAKVPSGRNSISTPPPHPQEPNPSSNPESVVNNNNINHHRPSQRSNWFFRASSAGSPHTRAGGRAGGGTSSKGDRGKEEEAERADEDHQPTTSRRRSESISRTRSRSRTGRVGSSSYLNGSRTDLTNAHISVPSTPSKLMKRKSIGFLQLGKSMVTSKENNEKRPAEHEVNDSPRKERYVGIGLGRATVRGNDSEARGRDASEHEGPIQREDEQERRRRKSFSKFLFDRDKENERNASSKYEVPEKEKDGSRGFMGSVRRISLVSGGKHKRTKSGSGVLVSIGEAGKAPPLPSSSLFMQKSKPPSKQLPYLLPLPVTSSQLSLRLPSPSSYMPGKQPFSHTGSMHDLPSLPFSRTASGASTQTQASNTSSVLPPSTVSSRSRNTTGSEQQTPLPPQRKASTRSRASGESARPRKSTTSRRSLDIKSTNDVSFVTKLSQYGNNQSDIASLPQQSNSFVVPSPSLVSSSSAPPPLLPPIELQPPSPPNTISKGPKPESKPSNILTNFDSNSTTKLSTSASSSSVFFTPSSSPQRKPPSSPSPNLKSSKLHVPLSPYNKSPQMLQQSASLGRATAGSPLSEAPQDGPGSNGGSPHPRRNSLGDLKIPARISQAQVGLRRDLGMVKEFANNVEQLKELQRIYDSLVVEIQSILDAYAVRQQTSPIPTALTDPVLPVTTFLALKPKKRPRSYTNPAPRSETNVSAPATPAQVSYNELASSFYVINSKYRITWECAELLIELGAGSTTGNSNDDFCSPQASVSTPSVSQLSSAHVLGSTVDTKRGRERAITLAGDESKPTQPPLVASHSSVPRSPDADRDSLISSPSNGPTSASTSMSWRTSTGRHDLSQRQVVLLREMLNNTRAHADVAADTDAGANSQADTPISEKSALTPLSHTHSRIQAYVGVNNDWKWGDPKNSTVTLPEDGDYVENGRKVSTDRKRRSGKLGMSGLRDLLRALKRGAIVEEFVTPAPVSSMPIHSTTSLSTESSIGSKRLRKSRQPSQRRRPRTGTVPDSIFPATEPPKGQEREPRSPYGPPFAAAKPSPRRPSLASVFRIGNKNHRPSNTTNNETGTVPRSEPAVNEIPARTGGTVEDSSSAEEDWDRMDSASDLDTVAKALGVTDGSATVRGARQCDGRRDGSYLGQPPEQSTHRPLITKRSFGTSQASIRCIDHQSLENNSSQLGNVPSRPIRLSNVEEDADGANPVNDPSSLRSVSQTHFGTQARLHKSGVTVFQSHPGFNKSGSVRSMPVTSATMTPLADLKPPLAMTPENIKPLLENSKEVQARLGDCIAELRALVSSSVVDPGIKDSSLV